LYDEQLAQGSTLPAVVVQIISESPTYVTTGRLHTGWSRIQFTIWGSRFQFFERDGRRNQLLAFLDQLNLIGIPGLAQYPCQVSCNGMHFYPKTQPPIFQRLVDAAIFRTMPSAKEAIPMPARYFVDR